MNGAAPKHQIWGTFSVVDHKRPGAFIADVIMYDKLVIPVPPSPSGDDKETAEERKRWEKWDPARQAKLMGILGDLAVPVHWNRQWRDEWEKVAAGGVEGSKMTAGALATGHVLLKLVPAMAQGAVAVAPYDSLEAMTKDLGITPGRLTGENLERGANLPRAALTAIVGRTFLVPEDPDKDEFDLLRDAVSVATDVDYREARADLNRGLDAFVNSAGKTDAASIEAAVKHMQRSIDAMRRANIWKRMRNAVRYSVFVGKTAMKVAAAPIAPMLLADTAISVADFTVNEVLAPAGAKEPRPNGALFVDAQQRLGLNAAGERATGAWQRILDYLAAE